MRAPKSRAWTCASRKTTPAAWGRPLVHFPMSRSRAEEALLGQRPSRTANSMGPLCLEVT